MAIGAGRRGLPTATLLGLLTLLAGPVTAAEGDGLSIESQLYITAGLLGGLAFVLTIAVVYLLLTLNRIQSDVLRLTDTITQQKQQQQQPATKRANDADGVKDLEDQPTQKQLQPVSKPQPASQQLSQPMSQQQSQPMSQMQPQPISQQQSQLMSQPQLQSLPQTAFMPQSQQQSSYQPATSPGYNWAPPRQQPYGGAPQRPNSAVPHSALRREPSYGGAPVAAYGFPAQAPQRATMSPNQNVSSGHIYSRDRY